MFAMNPLNILLALSLTLGCTACPQPIQEMPLRYDNTYDNASGSLTTVACSDGENGLITHGFTTFPYIGEMSAIEGWNSPNCGSCWNVTYTNAQGIDKRISVLAVVHTFFGFNVAQKAMDDLTGNLAALLGRVQVGAVEVAPSFCGM